MKNRKEAKKVINDVFEGHDGDDGGDIGDGVKDGINDVG